jgi:CheY-like chemotaxis protein
MTRILIVEDNPNRIAKFTRCLVGTDLKMCKTAEEAKSLLKAHTFDLIFLDHDLGENQECVEPPDVNSGTEVVRYMVANVSDICKERVPHIIIHSMNTYRSSVMYSDLVMAGYGDTEQIPFSVLNFNTVN